MADPVRVAVVQTRAPLVPVDDAIDALEAHVARAAEEGAKLAAFSETFIGGYPAWVDHCQGAALWNSAQVKEIYGALRDRSLVVGGRHTDRLCEIAADHEMVVVVGANERVDAGAGNGTLYNSLLTIDPAAGIVKHHRKLVPTHGERLVWGRGDGSGLGAADTRAGRVGSLVCWEHWMPLARQAMHDSGEEIHVAAWPAVGEAHRIASRHYAFEGRCFVLAAGTVMPVADLPSELECAPHVPSDPDALVLDGGSAIIGPDGRWVVEPVFGREELVVADLDLRAAHAERMTLDVSGHYARPDVFDFRVRTLPGEDHGGE